MLPGSPALPLETLPAARNGDVAIVGTARDQPSSAPRLGSSPIVRCARGRRALGQADSLREERRRHHMVRMQANILSSGNRSPNRAIRVADAFRGREELPTGTADQAAADGMRAPATR